MELHRIQYFLAVVDHGGINAAAMALDLAQPTISQGIRGLERECGVPLFDRIGRGMVLTSAGHTLVGPARRIVRDVVAAEGALVDAAGQPRGRLDIVTTAGLADPVARLVGAFRLQYGNVSIRIGDLQDEAAGTSLIKDGHCEIVMCHLPTPEGSDLEQLELGTHEWWLALPPASDVPDDDPLPLSALPDLPYVTVPRGHSQADEIEQAVAQAGRAMKPAAVVQHREARMSFVLSGVGGTFLERSMADAAVARGAIARAVLPELTRAYGLIYDPSGLSPAGRAFVGLARENAHGA